MQSSNVSWKHSFNHMIAQGACAAGSAVARRELSGCCGWYVFVLCLPRARPVFAPVCGSDFVFSKLHNTGHTVWFIKRYGALWATCSGRFEHFHKYMKMAYVMTSRRTKSYFDEMTKRLAFHRQLAHAIIILTAAVRSCAPPKKLKYGMDPCETAFVGFGTKINVAVGIEDRPWDYLINKITKSIYKEVMSSVLLTCKLQS